MYHPAGITLQYDKISSDTDGTGPAGTGSYRYGMFNVRSMVAAFARLLLGFACTLLADE